MILIYFSKVKDSIWEYFGSSYVIISQTVTYVANIIIDTKEEVLYGLSMGIFISDCTLTIINIIDGQRQRS